MSIATTVAVAVAVAMTISITASVRASRHNGAQINHIFGFLSKHNLPQLTPIAHGDAGGQNEIAIVAALFIVQDRLTHRACATQGLGHEAGLGNLSVAKS